MRLPLLAGLLLAVVLLAGCAATPANATDPTVQDAMAVLRLTRDAKTNLDELDANTALWSRSSTDPLTADERAFLMPKFATYVDHDLALGSYRDVFRANDSDFRRDGTQDHLLGIAVTAHAAQMLGRMHMLALVGKNEALRKALDEGSREYGVAAGHLTRIAIESARPDNILRLQIGLEALDHAHGKAGHGPAPHDPDNKDWRAVKRTKDAKREGHAPPPDDAQRADALDTDGLFVSTMERGLDLGKKAQSEYSKVSGKLLPEVIGTMVGNEVEGVISPIVASIALWLGDSRIREEGEHLISEDVLEQIRPKLEPGDIILERRNWYLSNLGLPGFWPHSAIHVGSPDELAAWAAGDPEIAKAFPNGLNAYLAAAYPEAWAAYSDTSDGEPMRVLESVSEGVGFHSIQHSCLADYVAFLRPRRTKLERARALANAFSHFGKPYDFDFDFLTNESLVCSELVYQAYSLKESDGRGVTFPLVEVLGRQTLPPNNIIEQFDNAYDTPDRQLDFVGFIDGDEAAGSAHLGTLEDLRASWKRPKWDLSQQ